MPLDKNLKRTYSIEPYNPKWVAEFQALKEMLESVFGKQAIAIEHVGSTSIPGMKAKPIIDILITVERMEPFLVEKNLMEQKGYEWGENYIEPESLVFFKVDQKDGSRKIENIHVCVAGSPKARQFILMRDYFRVHPEYAKGYSDIKVHLKEQFPDDYPAYRAGKKGFLDHVEKLATDSQH